MIDNLIEWLDENSTTALIIILAIFIIACAIVITKCSTDKPIININPREGNCSNIIGIYDESGEIVCSFGTDLWFTCSEKIRQPNGKYRPVLGCY